MAKKESKEDKISKKPSVPIVIVGLIILGVINTIGIYWGKDGMIKVGLGILFAIGVMFIIILNME